MAEQDIDFFDYVDENKRPPLLNKHLLISDNDACFKKQKSFDQRLSKLLDIDWNKESIIQRSEFNVLLEKAEKEYPALS